MAIPPTNDISVIDQMPALETIEFGLGDPRWIMKSQAKMYSDLATAVIREYSTNARDANIMAGNSNPIHVTLPVDSIYSESVFVVRDEGVGMDMDQLRETYTQFGVSDKRGSNDTNGMLGYGSKSGIAYAPTFTVRSTKNGWTIEGVVVRRKDWSIALKVLSREETNEPNGTTITVPVHNASEFYDKAMLFYSFWAKGSVLVDGVEPTRSVTETEIAPGFYESPDYNSYVVMNNVPYRLNNMERKMRLAGVPHNTFVHYVAPGSVEFTPSREDLEYTETTEKTISDVIDKYKAELTARVVKQMAEAANHAQAYLIWKSNSSLVGNELTLSYKGDDFKTKFVIDGHYYRPASYAGRSASVYKVSEYSIDSAQTTLFIVNMVPGSASSYHKSKMRSWAGRNRHNLRSYVYTTAPKIDSPWVSKSNIIDWQKLLDEEKAYAASIRPKSLRRVRAAGTFDIITSKGFEAEQDVPEDGDIAYMDKSEYVHGNVIALLDLLGSDLTVIITPKNRVNKFLRENPHAEKFSDWVEENVVKVDSLSLITDDEKKYASLDYSEVQILKSIPRALRDTIADTEILDFIRVAESNLEKTPFMKMKRARVLVSAGMQEFKSVAEKPVFTKYPVLEYMTFDSYYSRQRSKALSLAVDYMNMVHLSSKEGS